MIELLRLHQDLPIPLAQRRHAFRPHSSCIARLQRCPAQQALLPDDVSGEDSRMKWSETSIARALAIQVFNRKHLIVVPNCGWPGREAHLLGPSGRAGPPPPGVLKSTEWSDFGLMTHLSLSHVLQASNADDLVRALGFLSLRTEQGVPCTLLNRRCPFRCRRFAE